MGALLASSRSLQRLDLNNARLNAKVVACMLPRSFMPPCLFCFLYDAECITHCQWAQVKYQSRAFGYLSPLHIACSVFLRSPVDRIPSVPEPRPILSQDLAYNALGDEGQNFISRTAQR